MRAFRKDFIREITKNKGRFLSVFFIVLLGAAFFSGIRSAEGDMKVSADRYYDEVNYMDLKVLGTLGLTDDDLADIAKTDGYMPTPLSRRKITAEKRWKCCMTSARASRL